jgi:hypothetical protein
MGPITEELIHQSFDCYEGTKIEKAEDGWLLTTPAGRTVNIQYDHIDFRGITKTVPGETEYDREQLQFELESLATEAWGCVDIRKMDFIESGRMAVHAKAYGFTVDENTFREFGISDAKAEYGEAATVRNNWFPTGWRITVPDVGFAVIGMSGDELNVRRIEGDLYEQTLRFLEKKQGHAVVRGKTPFCSTWVVHGEMLGVRVIPEIPRSFWSIYLLGHVGWAVGAVVMLPVWGMFSNIAFWKLGLGAWAVASAAVGFLWGNDRKRGEVLLNKFPQMGSRNAKLDDARARGML